MSSSKIVGIHRQEGDLGIILSGMNASTEQTMSSLYDQQALTVDANGEARKVYKHVRETLKKQWEGTIHLLKLCHSFGEDVAHLKVAFKSASKKDLEQFLQEMASKCRQCVETTEELRKGCDRVYSSHGDNVCSHLDQSGPVMDLDHRFSSVSLVPTHIDGSSDTLSTDTGQSSRPFDSVPKFITSNMHTPPLAAKEAIQVFESFTRSNRQQLEVLSNFLKKQSEICAQCLIGLENPTHALEPRHVQDLVTQWEGYQIAIMNSINSISKICDVIMIEADAARYGHAPDRAHAIGTREEHGNIGDQNSEYKETPYLTWPEAFLTVFGVVFCLILTDLLTESSSMHLES